MIDASALAAGLSSDDRARYETFLRCKVQHRKQKDVLMDIWRSVAAGRVDHNITAVVGPTGVGKTNLVDLILAMAADEHVTRGRPLGTLASLRVTAAPPQHADFRFPSFFRSILKGVDEVLIDHKSSPAATGRTYGGLLSDALQEAAINVLRHRDPVVFCVDEAQHMTYAVNTERMRRHFDLLKWMADQVSSPILLAGTHELLKFSLLSGQLGRRVRHVPFLPYAPTADDLGHFLGAAEYFRVSMPITCSFDVKKRWEFLFEGSVGSVGMLKPWFDRVLLRCLSEGRDHATLADFELETMPGAKLQQIAEEINDCRERLRALSGDRATLRKVLGFPAPAKKSGSTRTTKPGQRTLQRDPVGIEPPNEDAA